MRIIVISLEKAVDRQALVVQQLSGLGMPFEFLSAVDGATVYPSSSCEVDDETFLLSTGRNTTAGEVGCYLSHRKAWRLCSDSNQPLLIMEDDFALSDDFPFAVQLLESHIRKFGFIRLQSETRARKIRVKQLGRFTLWRYTKAPNSAMCYGLSVEGARKLLSASGIIDAPVDVFMREFWRHGQRMYGITPYSVTENDISPKSFIAGRKKARKSLSVRARRTALRLKKLAARTTSNVDRRREEVRAALRRVL